MNDLCFTVTGHPEPGGSKRTVPTRADWQRVPGVRWKVLDANKNVEGWKELVAATARGAMLKRRMRPLSGPLVVEMTFFRERPAAHLTSKGALSREGHRHPFPETKPDVLKLARAVEDALSGVVYDDDAQIVDEVLRKRWGPESVEVRVMTR